MDYNLKNSFKRHLKGLMKSHKRFRLEEEYFVGDFRADIVLIDVTGIPAVIFEVKDNYTPIKNDDIRSWDVVYRVEGKPRVIPLLLAYLEKDTWHFRDANDSEVDLVDLLESLYGGFNSNISKIPFYVVGAGFCLIALIGIIAPMIGLSIAPITKEIVVLICAAGLCFVIPSIFPHIKVFNWKGGYVTFVHKVQ